MTICWNCNSDIGDLYKICPICLTILEEVICHRCGRNETSICTTSGYMYGKPMWIESEGEDEEGNWDGNYLCHECWLKIYDHNINPCCICGNNETKLDARGGPIWYPHYNEQGEWDEKYVCYHCHMKKYYDSKNRNNGKIDDDTKRDKLEELHLEKDRIDLDKINPYNIQSCRQNIPELIVRDCIREFGLDEEQAERMRTILLVRGTNKWFFARREFIRLKHEVKEMLKSKEYPYNESNVHRTVEKIYVKMQNIAKLPRWIWWPNTITHKWKKIEDKIIIKGRRI